MASPRTLQAARYGWRVIGRRDATTSRRSLATASTVIEADDRDSQLNSVLSPPPAPLAGQRKQNIRNAKPFSEFLTDTFHRQHDYLRISVTERCNLRCLYCMPEEGIQLSPNKNLLTSAEIFYLSALFVNQGVNKIRLTGGEPTVRKDIVPLMQQIGSLRRNGLKELALTTNGISLHRKLDAMVEAGLTGVNISLDTLDPFQFQLLTRRQGFDAVLKSINRVQEMNKMGAGVKLKINAVAMRGLNDHQILPFVEMTRDEDIEIRFIEYMPFDGNRWSQNKMLPYSEMLDMIRQKYPTIARLTDAKNDTSKTWQVPGFKGRFGFITSMTHNFCGSCNRLRITSDGNLKVCLHGDAEVSLRDLLREGTGGEPMDEAAFEALRQLELDRRKDGTLRFDGEEGWMSKETQLLEVIGAAVKRKKAKHAGMGQLENMKNRPMILIDEPSKASLKDQYSFSCTISPSPQNSNPWSQLSTNLLSLPQFRSHATKQVRQKSSIVVRNDPTVAIGKRDENEVASQSLQHLESKPSQALKNDDEENIELNVESFATMDLQKTGPSSAISDGSLTTLNNNTELTHVKSSGEARMVDVGSKAESRRVAIAYATVVFGNPQPHRLILENSNKKGDVLAVARVAGIMAAKRTPDLIPLCHPINISKVDLDVKLADPTDRTAFIGSRSEHGAVDIIAQVTCTGPTGVEMEALTAAMGAALTVYDMCKAVDRTMEINKATLLYKSGGRSGLYVNEHWARLAGSEFFLERGLDMPSL